jgi:chromosome segregation ATPase
MASEDRLTALRRSRAYYIGRITLLSKQLDEYEESSHQVESHLRFIEKRLNEVWTGFEATQREIIELDEEKHTRGLEIWEQYDNLRMRVSRHHHKHRRRYRQNANQAPVPNRYQPSYRRFSCLLSTASWKNGILFTTHSYL